MDGDYVLQLEVPSDLIFNQDVYIISSCANVNGNLKLIGLIVDVNPSTRKFRHTIANELLRDNEVELIIPINGYTNLRVNHMTMDNHTGRYTVWGKDYTSV